MDAIARSVPKYELLAGKVARQIQARSLLPGQPMPSVRSLMSEYHLSMGTVMKGLELLKAQGMVDRLPQRGYFVANTSSSKPRTRQIAFITQALSGDTSRYLAGFSQALDHQQYSLATYSSAHDQTLYQTIIEQVIRQQPAGIVLFAQLPETVCPMDPTSLAQCGIPTVSIGPQVRGLTCDRVSQNGSDSGKKLARHLLQRGCTDFAMLMYSCTAFYSRPMLDALRFELRAAGHDLPPERVFQVDSPHGFAEPIDPCIDAQRELAWRLAEGMRFKTLICCHDYPAVGAIRALAEAGLNVPDDVVLASGESCSVGGAGIARLTTMNCHRDEQARIAAELLLRRIDGYDGTPEVHYVAADLIIGDTA